MPGNCRFVRLQVGGTVQQNPIAECRAITAERRKMLKMELGRFESGLLAFVFDTSDRIQHVFWTTRDPKHPGYDPELAARYKHVIPDLYKEMDDVLGEVLARLDEETALLVLSDHGFGSFRRAINVNRWLIRNGYMELEGGNQKEGREIFQDVDWSRTKAYAMGFASIYLNVSGREGHGIVEPDEEYRLLREDIAARLRAWKDPRSGEPIFFRRLPV